MSVNKEQKAPRKDDNAGHNICQHDNIDAEHNKPIDFSNIPDSIPGDYPGKRAPKLKHYNPDAKLPINQPERYYELPVSTRKKLIRWIYQNIEDGNTRKPYKLSSYGLKHVFEADKKHGGEYVTNGEFKGAMYECGYEPLDKRELNWRYLIKLNKRLTIEG